MHYAHYDQLRDQAHPLDEHLYEVGALAARFAAAFGAEETARLAGVWHDLGKYQRDFQAMIAGKNGLAHIESDWREGQKVDHSSAGAVLALQKGLVDVAFVIAGHHAGLADKVDLGDRLNKKAAWLDRAEEGGAPAELLSRTVPKYAPPADKLREEMRIRMLFSALCDADFLDTERFYEPARADSRTAPVTAVDLAAALRAHLDALEARALDTAVNRVRREVRAACHAAAELSPGFFTLTVPTGGGKTLASLAFALDHAARHGLHRVIVAIPFTSIIEQTAEALRDALGALAPAVLEHHSALDPAKETPFNRIACDNWDAPIVVTTTVQLFESLFANRTSRCRKLHRLCRSVIVLDEAQIMPPGLIEPILDALKTLVADYGASVVVCTATQPALGYDPDRLKFGIQSAREIVPGSLDAFARLKRVAARWPRSAEPLSYEALAAELATERDVLAIVHKRKDARELCERIDALNGDRSTVHLSALMCPEHRSRVLAEVKARKRDGAPVRLVATQLVEAGVDVDFPVVYRALAGVDALAQAAGRCNREGKLTGLGELRIFRAATEPPPGVLQTALGCTESLLAELGGELELFEPEIYRRFFRRLYASVPLDKNDIQELRRSLRFKTVAGSFKMIEDDWSAAIVLPYAGGAKLIAELEAAGPSRDLLRRLQRYTIAMPKRRRDEWLDDGRARWIDDTLVALGSGQEHLYDQRFGLDAEEGGPSLVV